MSDNNLHIDWELAARVLNGEADEIDRGLLKQWLEADEANRKEWQIVMKSWEQGGDAVILKNVDTSSAWNRVRRYTVDEEHFQRIHSPHKTGIIWAITASVVLVLGLSWFLLSPADKKSSSLVVSNTVRGEEMVLSDGSAVTLNSRSKFSCQQPFDENERTVKLDGEGYFRVQGNKEWPFVIHAGEVTIRVTGTSFNVRAYPGFDITEVSVVEGRVEVVPPLGNDKVVLTKGETALFDKRSNNFSVEQYSDPNFLSWITQKIIFNETPLSEVAETLGRVYGVNIQVSDSTMAEEKLTARFSENSLDFVLEVVCTTFNLKSKREGESILLSRTSEQK
jgi:transmembrane sensor